MSDLDGRVVLLTGAARSERAALGPVFALALARHGAVIAAADYRDTASVVREIEAAGGSALAIPVDVRDETSVQQMVESTIARFGRIDVLVNNAAIGSNMAPIPVLDIRGDDWDEIYTTNVRGPFLCTKAVVPYMRSQGRGKIINIGSSMPLAGAPQRLHYVSAKGAVHTMTRSLSRELGRDGISVNTLAFGLITSQLNEQDLEQSASLRAAVFDRRAMPIHLRVEDVAGGLVFLASSSSDCMTGQMLMLDPGSV